MFVDVDTLRVVLEAALRYARMVGGDEGDAVVDVVMETAWAIGEDVYEEVLRSGSKPLSEPIVMPV
ncbi:hypothetical protein [Geochorda subterranea]|uniref:Uncharacterized protein n=1 Tax=Geochorda subterranea TaxID=3109564 RepID=A0ABZ1BP72_9FIRM|nr:hypothetical protein [Limnochorda sp. LNt]WRP14597.1 hypothetical protein VLY81_00040 [Limnochorda sp. LNt]